MAKDVDFKALGGRMNEREEKRINGGGGGNRPKINRVDLSKKVRIRPIGKAKEFLQIFIQRQDGQRRSVVIDEKDKDEAQRMVSAELGREVYAKTRFAMNCIVRPNNDIAILENGIQIFGQFGLWTDETGIHPGSKDGYDWGISPVQGSGDFRQYKATALQPAPLTPEEREKVSAPNACYDLEAIYASVPLNKVMERLFGKSDAGPAESAQPEPVEVGTSGDDDEFGF